MAFDQLEEELDLGEQVMVNEAVSFSGIDRAALQSDLASEFGIEEGTFPDFFDNHDADLVERALTLFE